MDKKEKQQRGSESPLHARPVSVVLDFLGDHWDYRDPVVL